MPIDIEDMKDFLEEHERMQLALQIFLKCVEDLGGVKQDAQGNTVLAGCPEWEELTEAYLEACDALDVDPLEQMDEEES